MSELFLRIAVVGHTNAGKTSLLRTLTRNAGFGEVSDRPATTRHVEGVAILVDGREAVHLFDTPGLEDSSGLRECLRSARDECGVDGLEAIRRFLDGDAATGRFAQEAKALRQVLAADVAMYVIDARDPVLGRYRDELEVLSWCARPVVPVLNFIASEGGRNDEWRNHLARLSLHAVAEFDTVVFDHQHEERLYEKLRTLVDHHRSTLDALIEHRRRDRRRLVQASARIIAEMLIDAAAHARWANASQPDEVATAAETLKDDLRHREQRCVSELVELHRFSRSDAEGIELSAIANDDRPDLFSPAALRQFGLSAGRGAAVGALVGLAADAMVGGLSLGAAAVAGAGLGALVESLRTQGRWIIRRAQGEAPMRCDDATLRLLALRQMTLCSTLLMRGHASQAPIRRDVAAGMRSLARQALGARLPVQLEEARLHPNWSGIGRESPPEAASSLRRRSAADALATLIEAKLDQPPGAALSVP